jgi:3-deoxy-D-manno-octulosonic-acid transferase
MPLIYRKPARGTAACAGAIRSRLKQGKEDDRVDERRDCRVMRDHTGRWRIHGASVGEVLAAAAGSSGCASSICASCSLNDDVGGDRRQRFHPTSSICALRLAALCRPLLRSLAAVGAFIESTVAEPVLSSAERRLPMVLINGRMSPRSSSLAPRQRHHRGAA